MQEARERAELQQGGIAFDGVRRSEERREQLGIVRTRLQRQEQLLHLREAFLGLFPKRLQQHFSIDFHDPSTKL